MSSVLPSSHVTNESTDISATTAKTATINTITNVDPSEVDKFNKLANEWWDKNGAFATLHEINPLRLNWITNNVERGYHGFQGNEQQDIGTKNATDKKAETGLSAKKIIDVGCGGGILSESMARRGADVTGIDLGAENLKAATLHAEQSGLSATLRYEHIAVETFAAAHTEQFDVVTCMEMLEHVPDPSAIVQACYDMLVPGGVCVLSTINRNPKSYLFAIVGAEYVLRLLDRGTHDYAKFITPAELDKMATTAGFTRQDIIGLHYNPLTKRYWLAQNVDVNYMLAVQKPL